jgi:tRNA (Thr-GGU) A37 N-methylase
VYEIEGNCLKVVGLDVLDGTPIIDIKKKID